MLGFWFAEKCGGELELQNYFFELRNSFSFEDEWQGKILMEFEFCKGSIDIYR